MAKDSEGLIHRFLTFGEETLEQVQDPANPDLIIHINYRDDAKRPMPVFLGYYSPRDRAAAEQARMLAADAKAPIEGEVPALAEYAEALLKRGCAVVTHLNTNPPEQPWPEGRPKWIWPTPDPAGAEAFTLTSVLAPGDTGKVIDYIETRPDLLRADRIGYLGGSTTALIGYGLLSKERRITCAVLGAGSGYLRGFIEGWARNYNWKEKGFELWPETDTKLRDHDPILFVEEIYPRALLMMNGGKDWLIPIESVIEYHEALYPLYAADPDRLQLVIFHGAGHGWDQEWNLRMTLDWFDRYLIAENPPAPRPRAGK